MEPGLAFNYNTGASHHFRNYSKTTGGETMCRLFDPLVSELYLEKRSRNSQWVIGLAHETAKLDFHLNGGRDGKQIV